MGQNVTVIAKQSSNPEVRRFEINRSLTGMGHERYDSLADVVDDRAVDQLARKILEHGGVSNVHINSSVITVRLAGGSTGDGLEDLIRNMFRFYGDQPGAAIAADVEQPETEDQPAAEEGETEVDAELANAPEAAADHAVAAEATPAEASDAPGDAPEPQPGEREPGEATAAAEDTGTNL